jgi:hypothetical protein
MNRWRFLLLSLGSLGWAHPGTAQSAPSKWLSYDVATKTVTFALEAGAPGTSGPVNFNGYTNGGASLVVPPASTVVRNFVNLDGTPHSASSSPTRIPCPTWAEIRPSLAPTLRTSRRDCPKVERTSCGSLRRQAAASGFSAASPGTDCPACGSASRWTRRPSRPAFLAETGGSGPSDAGPRDTARVYASAGLCPTGAVGDAGTE